VRLADLVWRIGGWLLAAALWALGMAWFVLRMTSATARFTGRMLFRDNGRRHRRAIA
jgi:hypothetical protein